MRDTGRYMQSLLAIPEEALAAAFSRNYYMQLRRFWAIWGVLAFLAMYVLMLLMVPWLTLVSSADQTGNDLAELARQAGTPIHPLWPAIPAIIFSAALSAAILCALAIQRQLWRIKLEQGRLIGIIDEAIAGSSPEVDEFLMSHGLVLQYTPVDEDGELSLKRELQMLIATRLDQFPNAWVHNIFCKRVGIVLLAIPLAAGMYIWTLQLSGALIRQNSLPWYYSLYCVMFTAWLAKYCFDTQAEFWLVEVQRRLGYVIVMGMFLMRLAEKRNRRLYEQQK